MEIEDLNFQTNDIGIIKIKICESYMWEYSWFYFSDNFNYFNFSFGRRLANDYLAQHWNKPEKLDYGAISKKINASHC